MANNGKPGSDEAGKRAGEQVTFPPTQVIGKREWIHIDDLTKMWDCSYQNVFRIASAQRWRKLKSSLGHYGTIDGGYFLAADVQYYMVNVRPNTIRHKA
jgi:hypothetical protein